MKVFFIIIILSLKIVYAYRFSNDGMEFSKIHFSFRKNLNNFQHLEPIRIIVTVDWSTTWLLVHSVGVVLS